MPLVFLALWLLFWILDRRQKAGHARRGYWVEYDGPNQLRASDDDFAVVYHEGANWKFFYGKLSGPRRRSRLTLPDEIAWEATMPEWLVGKRDRVISRIREDLRLVEVIDAPAQL